MKQSFIVLLFICLFGESASWAGIAGTAFRETAEFIMTKFGKGAAGRTVDEVTEATIKAISKHGEDALPLLRKTGHAGFTALQEAGEKAPDVIKLYARRGDEAIWIISERKKLAIFIKHGDSAADALLKHPGISDNLIGKYGSNAAGALNNISRQSAQRLSMISDDGLLATTKQNSGLLSVIRQYGDEAMDFIWINKGALATTAVLTTFLADPQAYISGAKELIIDPIAAPIVNSVNWTLIIGVALLIVSLPFIGKSISKACSAKMHV